MSKRRYIVGGSHLTRRRGKARLWCGYVEGKEVSLGTADRIEAQRRLDVLAEERSRAPAGAPAAPPPQLSALALLFAEYCRPPRHTPKTAHSYALRIAGFVEWAEGKKITRANEVSPAVISLFIRDRTTKGAGAATLNRDLTAIRQMYGFAEREGLIPENPFEGRDFNKLRLREPRPKPNALTLSPQQIDTFLDRADELVPAVYAALFRMTAGSAIRIDEARHLELGDLNVARGVLTVTPKKNWTTKGYRYREVPISAKTGLAALDFIRLREGVALDDKTVWKQMQIVIAAAKLPHCSMHDFRRAWASAVHAKGASLKQVSVWLGHSDIATTERYIRVFAAPTGGHEFLPR